MRQELRNALTGPKFIIAVLAMFVCFMGFSLPTWINAVAVGDAIYESAFSMSFAPIFFGGAILLIPFCAALPYATSQVDEIRSGFLFFKAIRGSTKKYALNKIVITALSGALAMFLANALHSIVWNLVCGPFDINNPNTQVWFSADTVYETLKYTPYAIGAYCHAALGFFLTGAVWALIGLAVSVWIPDMLLSVSIPVVLYYFWTYQILYQLFGIAVLQPAALYNDGQYWGMYGQAILLNVFIMLLSAVIYYLGLKRRLKNA